MGSSLASAARSFAHAATWQGGVQNPHAGNAPSALASGGTDLRPDWPLGCIEQVRARSLRCAADPACTGASTCLAAGQKESIRGRHD